MPLDTFTYYLLKVGFIPPLTGALGLTKNLVLPEPEPPITRTFLFRAYLGFLGRLDMVSRSVWVKITFCWNTEST